MGKQSGNRARPEKTFWGMDAALLIATLLVGILLSGLLLVEAAANPPAADADGVGFLVLAPDRGFTGNEETRDAFEAFAAGRNAALAFATDERTRGNLAEALEALIARGARKVVVLPFFLSASEPRFVLARGLIDPVATGGDRLAAPVPVEFAQPFGESYLAVEILADRLRAISDPAGRTLVVVGAGARTDEERRRLAADWQRLAERAAQGFGFAAVRTLVWHERTGFGQDAARATSIDALRAAAQGSRVVVVPFHLGRKLDSMMNLTGEIRRALPAGAGLLPDEVTPHPDVATWMARAANRHLPVATKDLGVVLLAHGSDYHWNEAVREGARVLEDRYLIEYAFSMADPPTIARAVRRLERRGARAAVIVRAFATSTAFKRDIERLIGLDVERDETVPNGQAGRHDDGHGAAGRTPVPRIRSALPLTTVGGLGGHPLFAQALLDRARALSKDPARETVILVGHGSGDDGVNARWLERLEAIAAILRAQGPAFRAVRVATWREDWPEKRAPWIARVRAMVEEATGDGGQALVIPARTTGRGPEQEFLAGLDYALGEGFAPHPLFAQWVEAQIVNGRSPDSGANWRAARQ